MSMTIKRNNRMYSFDLLKPGVTYKLTLSGSSVRNGTAFSGKIIRVVADTDVHIKFGDSSVEATSSDVFLPANTIEFFDRWSATHCAAIASSGNIYLTEMEA